jgi:hypothetical protein
MSDPSVERSSSAGDRGSGFVLSFDAPKASAATWSATRELVAPSVQTFSPELAVNHDGLAVAAWYSGPPPRVVSYGPRTASSAARWTGNKVVASLGSVAAALRKPVIVATNGTDQRGQIKVALSGSGVGYIAWLRSDLSGDMIVTSHRGRLSSPRSLKLPRGAHLARLAAGLNGPVDAFSDRANGHGFTFYCTRLKIDGAPGRTFVAAHPYEPNPCHLPHNASMHQNVPPNPAQPSGYSLDRYSLKTRSDGHGHSLAVWDDWPTGSGWTYGLFYSVERP